MTSEITLTMGKRTTRMVLTTWQGGAALTSVDNTAPTVAPSSKVFTWNKRTGEVGRYDREKFAAADKR